MGAEIPEEDLKLRPHASPGVDRGLEYGYWWVEWGGMMNTVKDNEQIRDDLLEIMLGVWNHIKNDGDHGAENWALSWFGFLPGKRESRRFIGQHILNENEILACHDFHDAIAYGGWSLDTHPPEGVDAIEQPPCDQPRVPYLYGIPLRSCVSRDIDNLMFAGRNISATHIGFSSTRVMATCAVLGQGAGTAAAHAVTSGIRPKDISDSAESVAAIQQRLLRDDAFLVGVRNEDPCDLAPQATASATTQKPEGPASNTLTGQSRAVHGEGGIPVDHTSVGTHRWMSESLPASLDLRWPSPVSVSEIDLIFDTGMHRPLTLSHSDAYVEKMEWGHPQPETVRDYLIEGEVDGEWVTLCKEEGNYQRHRRHKVTPSGPISALRVVVTATNGIDHARICEIRAYA